VLEGLLRRWNLHASERSRAITVFKRATLPTVEIIPSLGGLDAVKDGQAVDQGKSQMGQVSAGAGESRVVVNVAFGRGFFCIAAFTY
jgi:hypothetical protein